MVDGIKISRPSLEDIEGEDTILRGVISLDSLPNLRVDHYQRERLSSASNRQIQRAISMGIPLPDITLGMRGDRFMVDDEGAVVLTDPVFIIDGQQRTETIKAHFARFPEDRIRLGAIVYFNTNEFAERQRFHALNLFSTKVSASVIMRNSRQDNPLLASLYGLSITDRNFAMYRRIGWKQTRVRDELITASTYILVGLYLHGHMAATRRSSQRYMMQGLDNLGRATSIQTVRENVATFWELIDASWGVRELGANVGVPYLKGSFLGVVATILSQHVDFWQDHKLVIPTELKRRFKLFKPYDPSIARLASVSGAGRDMLRLLIIDHLNARMRKKLTARLPVVPEAAD